jgi:hypothetical protein
MMMCPRSPEVLTENLHDTNSRLRFWLESLASDRRCPGLATPQEMGGLLSELLRAGEWLRGGLPADRDPALESELAEYRSNLGRLREVLPSIHRQLLLERARLEEERTRVDSAAIWAQGARQSL